MFRPTAILLGGVLLWSTVLALGGQPAHEADDPFAIDGAASIMEEAHLGIVNGKLTAGIRFKDVAWVDGLWAPPYVSSDFGLHASVHGKPVATQKYTWRPYRVDRSGTAGEVRVTSVTALVPGYRAGVLAITVENTGKQPQVVPVAITADRTLDRSAGWEFAAPTSKTATHRTMEDGRLVLEVDDRAIVVQAAEKGLAWDGATGSGRVELAVAPGARATLHVVFSMGSKLEAVAACQTLAADPRKALATVEDTYRARCGELGEKLPRLESTNAALVQFYDRSLVHFLMNRWDVPEFILHPYYSTGSVRGGCVCDYLWNFGETWEILPLVDAAAARAHIGQFLKTDMTKHFAFNPLGGEAFGPWYMVNQEKTVGLIYYYVKNTGDTAFLAEKVDGKTILEHVLAHGRFGDDPSKPVALIDYGSSNSHLELRRGYPYNHVMPDLNGRRYANYLMAWRLAEVAGKPAPELRERAAALKSLLKQSLWNPKTRWFDFITGEGRKDTRYTVQMFKLFGSGVLDDEETAGLLGHLNEREFFSAEGLHSMSKTDIAYDQVDIDNGGGGNCTCFPPQIAERLYKSGHAAEAEEILRRLLWWGQRMPYWGDSLVANAIDYRKDTPLQCTIDGVTVAQCIIFGMFGVCQQFDGDLVIDPHPPAFAADMALRGLKLRGRVLDIVVRDGQFEVTMHGQSLRAKIGQAIVIHGDRLLQSEPKKLEPGSAPQ